MTTMQTIRANVTDTNNRSLGTQTIRVEFSNGDPLFVEHAGRTYTFNGKRGTNDRTGREVVSCATADDARIWITLDGIELFEA